MTVEVDFTAAGKPFGPYEDMAACIADNQDKDDPEAWCAELEQTINGEEEGDEAVMSRSQKRDVEDTRDLLRKALTEKFRNFGWLRTFDPDEGWAVFESRVPGAAEMDADIGMTLLKVSYEDSGDEITISDDPPVEVERETETRYVEKGKQRGELTGPFVFKDSKRQIGYAAVLVPGEPDSDNESLTADKVEEVAHGWMESYRNIDLQHSLNNLEAHPVESHVLRQAEQVNIDGVVTTLPKGTWVLASKFNDEKTWQDIESGKYQGYSVMGVQRKVVKEAATKSMAFSFKKTLLEDLGDDWIATHVSVVDEPAVPKAKWFALKSAKPSLTERIKGAFTTSAEPVFKEGRKFSAATFKALKDAHSAIEALISEAEKERETKASKQTNDGRDGDNETRVVDEFATVYVKNAIKRSMEGDQ